ncbi:MAG: hypothetical protein DMG40_16640 [Acidobacteria bacterium]|nr:MAG: hypothetical protein DMG40_16640 [Acidobacteriota bacterium]
MITTQNSPAAVRQRKRRSIILTAIASSLVVLALVVFFGVGRWLVVEDPLAKARAIVVLSGGMPVRAASEDPFDSRHWWGNSRDALEVVREVLGLMNAWAGLPLPRAR